MVRKCFLSNNTRIPRDKTQGILVLSLHRYALGEVAGTVHVLALADGDVVGQKLQGNAGDKGLEALHCVGQGDDVVGKLLNLRVTLGYQGCYPSASCAYLLYITDDLLIEAVTCGDDEDGHLAVNKGDGAVLHLGGGVAFGMDIADFLQFKGAFQCYGEVIATA